MSPPTRALGVIGLAAIAAASLLAASSADERPQAGTVLSASRTLGPPPAVTPERYGIRVQAELDAYLRALHDREVWLAQVAANQEAERRAAAAAARRNAERASRSAAVARRAPLYGAWAELINRYPWPADVAYNVMMCESSGNANAYNASSGATGLFQILNGPFDPAQNVALAFQMWQRRGWQPWRACI